MRRPGSLALIAIAGLIAAGCGGSSPASPNDGAEPGSTSGVGAPTAASGVGNGGAVEAVAIADAAYTTGSAHAEVTGGRQLTFDAQLLPGVSMTTEGTTLLMYPADQSGNGALLSISNGSDTGLALTITGTDVSTGGDTTTGCSFELTQNDAAGLAGRFECRGITSIAPDMPTVDVRGSFSAAP